MELRRLWDEGFARRKSCSASGRAGSDDVQWTPCSPLGALSRCPPLSDRSLSVKTLPEFAQAGGGGALGVVPSLEASSLENLFRCSLRPWLVAIGGGAPPEASLLENQLSI